jgi:oligopeptidase A
MNLQANVATGPWVFTLDPPSYLPAMKHLKNRALREQLYVAYVTRASAEDTDNTKIMREVLLRKRELAHMLVRICYVVYICFNPPNMLLCCCLVV